VARRKRPVPSPVDAEADRSEILVSLRTLSEYLDVSTVQVNKLATLFPPWYGSVTAPLFVSSDPLISRYQQQIVALAAENNLPAIYAHSHFPKAGGLMAYAADLDSLGARAGSYVAEILKGA
jgi:ABC-type uncharacterized transport system substrate-binding protein